MRLATLAGVERAQSIHELKLDATPEGIVAFAKLMIEKLGRNEIDIGRASAVNSYVQTILRTTESGIDAVKSIEEDTRHLEETLRTSQPQTRRVTS